MGRGTVQQALVADEPDPERVVPVNYVVQVLGRYARELVRQVLDVVTTVPHRLLVEDLRQHCVAIQRIVPPGSWPDGRVAVPPTLARILVGGSRRRRRGCGFGGRCGDILRRGLQVPQYAGDGPLGVPSHRCQEPLTDLWTCPDAVRAVESIGDLRDH